jgi:hypothetical protein
MPRTPKQVKLIRELRNLIPSENGNDIHSPTVLIDIEIEIDEIAEELKLSEGDRLRLRSAYHFITSVIRNV